MAKKGIKIDPNTILTISIAVGAIWALGGLKKLFNALNFTDTQDTKDINKIQENLGSSSNYWNPNFWKVNGAIILKDAACIDLFKTIDSAWGYFDDDEEKIFGAIKKYIRYQSQWSYFAYWLAQKKNIDLFDYMRGGKYWSRFEDSDMKVLNDYLRKLPKYK
jgi:hypothetical protein